jgi:glutaredoxin-like YruB-family protein
MKKFFGSNFRKKMVFLTAAIFIQACLLTPLVSAEIYQWRDADGNIFYGDSPPSGIKTIEKNVKVNKIVRPESAKSPQEGRQIPQKTRLRDINDISVILYATDWCPYCKKTREYLNAKGIRFTEYDIDKDRNKREEMRRKSGSNGVPVLDIEGTIIRGFNRSEISSTIESKRKANN